MGGQYSDRISGTSAAERRAVVRPVDRRLGLRVKKAPHLVPGAERGRTKAGGVECSTAGFTSSASNGSAVQNRRF